MDEDKDLKRRVSELERVVTALIGLTSIQVNINLFSNLEPQFKHENKELENYCKKFDK